MTREQELRQAIIDAPDDLSLRLIYADHLQELGDVRGEYIALACTAAGELRAKEMRRRALWQHYGPEWQLEDLGFSDDNQGYYQGFCNWLTVTPSTLTAITDKLLRQPLRHLRINAMDNASLAGLAANPILPRLRMLSLSTRLPEPEAAAELIDAARNLSELSFNCYATTSNVWAALERCASLERITALDLGAVGISAERARWLVERFPRLTDLTLSGVTLHADALFALAQGLSLEQLSLGLGEDYNDELQPFTDAHLAQAIAGPWSRTLTRLVLDGHSLGHEGITAITRLAPRLEELAVSTQAPELCAVFGAHDWPVLDSLDLAETPTDMLDLRRCPELASFNTSAASVDGRRLADQVPRLLSLNVRTMDDAGVAAIMTLPLNWLAIELTTTTAIDLVARPNHELHGVWVKADDYALEKFANAPWDRIDSVTMQSVDRVKSRLHFRDGWIERQNYFTSYERKLALSGEPVPNR